ATMARSSLVGVVLLLAGVWWVAQPAAASWPWLVASVVVHVCYNLGLAAAYRLGDFNQTYPLARGIGPIAVAVVAVGWLHEPLPALPAAGVALVAGAVVVLGLSPWREVRRNRSAVVIAAVRRGHRTHRPRPGLGLGRRRRGRGHVDAGLRPRAVRADPGFREPLGRVRIAASVAVTVGVALLAV
ncbi:MAG TPA: hypothetical protein VFM55_03885, partial [Micromonosporaceae bacterium]|nr:hypothetical protein [Micromonosporaceae bacterium]